MSLNLRGSNQYFDAETGLHYNLHRYFDSDAGRYLTPDPSGQAGWVTALASATGAIAFAIVAYDIVAGIINAAIQVNNAKCVRGLRLIGEKLAKQVSDGLTTGLVGLLVGGAAAKIGRGLRNIIEAGAAARAAAAGYQTTQAAVAAEEIAGGKVLGLTFGQKLMQLARQSQQYIVNLTRLVLRNDGKLGEQVSQQLLKELTGADFKGILNASNNGPDLVAIDNTAKVIYQVEVKSTQGTSAKWPTNLSDAQFRVWIKEAEKGFINGIKVDPASQAYAIQVQIALDQGYSIQHYVAKVVVPNQGQAGNAIFTLYDWAAGRPAGF